MSSTALYRKYRPSCFDGVIGQEHITATLRNQIAAGRIGHAYLFCGSRGVGKTSLARIFAKAINCADSLKAPCGKCNSCLGESGLDIIEIDAASNNGVDDARDLREKVIYPPISGKYKVYIIDEVHMLTGSAFNALLKTLEEPPAHAVFILATTEPHKLPATVLSRCMRFDFHLVPMQLLCQLIGKIYQSEGKQYEDDAVRAIAAAAEGSVRDALSLADTCISLTAAKLRLKDVLAVMGAGDEKAFALLDAVNRRDIRAALGALAQLNSDGKSMNVVAKELASFSRDLMLAKAAPEALETTQERLEFLTQKSAEYTLANLAALVQLFSEIEPQLRYSVSPRVAMEAAIIRAVKLSTLDINALEERILRLENALAAGVQPASPVNVPVSAAGTTAPTVASAAGTTAPAGASAAIVTTVPTGSAASTAAPARPAAQSALTAAQLWGRILTFLRRNSPPALFQLAGRQNPERIMLSQGLMTIYATRENFLPLCGSEIGEELNRAVLNEGLSLRIKIEKDTSDVDMEKEVTAYMAEFGREKVTIIK